MDILSIVTGIFDKVKLVIATPIAWLCLIATCFFESLGDNYMPILAIGMALCCDLIAGTAVSIRRGHFILSYLIKQTCAKGACYLLFIYPAFLIEKAVGGEMFIVYALFCVIAGACELISISGNILILKPDFPFFSLLRKYLYGEIAKKLDSTPAEVKDVMENKKKLI